MTKPKRKRKIPAEPPRTITDRKFQRGVLEKKRAKRAIVAHIRQLESEARRPGCPLSHRHGLGDLIAALRARLST